MRNELIGRSTGACASLSCRVLIMEGPPAGYLSAGGGFKVARVPSENSADLALIGQPIKEVRTGLESVYMTSLWLTLQSMSTAVGVGEVCVCVCVRKSH